MIGACTAVPVVQQLWISQQEQQCLDIGVLHRVGALIPAEAVLAHILSLYSG